jgi:phenylalanyl-tRNA synthetase alpha chain
MTTVLEPEAARHALAVRDLTLTDPGQDPHAVRLLLDEVEQALAVAWSVPVLRHRANPVVPVADNYDRLGYPAGAAVREARHTRYLASGLVLRTQTSAMIPPLLQRLAGDPPADVLLSCPGIVYRRDLIDRHHVSEPHQADLWRVRTRGTALFPADLDRMIEVLVRAAVPGRRWRIVPADHPYTLEGRQVDVEHGGGWVEVAECGLAHPDVLGRAGLPPTATGLAMGIGLDRLVMLRKGIDDIRLLRSDDPRVVGQLSDLAPYRPVSTMPPARRDLSIAVDAGLDPEQLGDLVRQALGPDAASLEEVRVLSQTPAEALPPAARARLGIGPGQKNVLLRLVVRDLERTLTAAEANRLRDRVYAALHAGRPEEGAGEGK